MEKYYWLNKKSRDFLSRGYLQENQTAEERVRQIAEAAEKYLGIKGYADKFEDYMSRGWFSLSSPVWANYGTGRGLPVSCNGSWIGDDMESILGKLGEISMMTKHGAGTSAYFGELRPRGAKISKGGESSGPVHFMELFDCATNVISQSNVRRGSMAAYLPVEHPDIMEFLKIRDEGNPIQGLSIGVCIGDQWMKDLLEGDKAKRKIWSAIVKKRFESGYPYIHFSDTVNNSAPQVYKDKGKKIHASNLCVAPETFILTDEGYIPISSLENQDVRVFNGKEYSTTKVIKTGVNQKLIKVILDSGRNIECTEYHKFYIDKNSDLIEVRAADLKKGDLVRVVDRNLRDGSWRCSHDFLEAVSCVVDEGRFDDTYCVNEPLEHKAVFNGILTGNCNEIELSSSQDESFVCVLSSLNLLHWDEFKDTDAIETMMYFLDTVTEEYIQKTANMKFMEAAHNFAVNQRAVGLGVLGWHSYLQSKMISFESMEAKLINAEIFKTIDEKSLAASKELAKKYGEPPLLKGYGERMVTRTAIAPTTSSSFILGQVSPSIECLDSNYFVKDMAKGKHTYKNPYLKQLLQQKDQDTSEVWKSILIHGGSVQHLDFLSQEEKDVFKTFGEIPQKEIVIQAAQRAKYLCQSQSLNLMIPASAPAKEASQLMIFAWENGVKGLYYQRSSNPAQELARSILKCSSCEA